MFVHIFMPLMTHKLAIFVRLISDTEQKEKIILKH